MNNFVPTTWIRVSGSQWVPSNQTPGMSLAMIAVLLEYEENDKQIETEAFHVKFFSSVGAGSMSCISYVC